MIVGELKDSLSDQLTAIETALRERGLALVRGWVETGKSATIVHWDVEDDNAESWRGYLDQAKASGATAVVAHAERLTAEEVEEVGNGEAGSDREQAVDEARPHIGHVSIIQLCWFAPAYPGVAFTWQRSTSWFDALADGGEEATAERPSSGLSEADRTRFAGRLAASAEFQRLGDCPEGEAVAKAVLPASVVESRWDFLSVLNLADIAVRAQLGTTPEVEQLARTLAGDARFQRARNNKQRRHAATQVLPSEVVDHRVKLALVIDLATTIYEVDLKGSRRHA
jgi:hypothetical protein